MVISREFAYPQKTLSPLSLFANSTDFWGFCKFIWYLFRIFPKTFVTQNANIKIFI